MVMEVVAVVMVESVVMVVASLGIRSNDGPGGGGDRRVASSPGVLNWRGGSPTLARTEKPLANKRFGAASAHAGDLISVLSRWHGTTARAHGAACSSSSRRNTTVAPVTRLRRMSA